MPSKPTGGPAFPGHGTTTQTPDGMSLRDYFAAHAPVQYRSVTGDGHYPASQVRAALAEERYRYADAMLAERDKP